MKYERLFSPITINGMELKNRVLMPALNHIYTPEGSPTPRFTEYYKRRAEGGVGLIIVGGCRFEKYGGTYEMISLEDDSFIPGFKEFTDVIHEAGAKVGVQLFHAGRYAHSSANDGLTPIAPSEVYSGYSRATPKEMTIEEIKTVQRQWADAAVRAKKAGFDMVEILASAGYLICQFLAPMTNLRTDEYGGSWENRTRFARELVAVMRAAVGPDYPIGMRIAGNDLVPGCNNTEDAVNFAKDMEAAGVDLLNVTGGWHESKVPQITGDLPRGGFDHIAAAVKDAVSIPVVCGNRINDPAVAERLLATECCDMVSVGRPHVADPDWCNKAMAGEEDLIRRCMACNQGCLANAFFNKPIECLVNAEAGREYELVGEGAGENSAEAGAGATEAGSATDAAAGADAGKNILVIGAGAAGCEFAIRSAARGNNITIWEESDRIGGQLNLVAMPPAKKEFFSLIAYYEASLAKAGVRVEFCKKADAEDIEAAAKSDANPDGFDIIVSAAGRGQAKKIPLDIDDSVEVVSAYDILDGSVVAGRDVIVIGGGSVGCETAQFMAHEASVSPEQVYHMLANKYMPVERVLELMNSTRRNISVVDVVKVGSGFQLGTGWPVLGDMKRLGVKSYSFAATKNIKDGVATLDVKKAKDSDETEEVKIPVDTVVMSVGALPNEGLFDELSAYFENADVKVYNIGDSAGIANVKSAVEAGCRLAEEIG